MITDDLLVPLDITRFTVPPIFAHHHLQHEGIPTRYNEATNEYGSTTIFVPLSQLDRAYTALAQMQADFDAANADEEVQRGAVSLTDPADPGALEIVMGGSGKDRGSAFPVSTTAPP